MVEFLPAAGLIHIGKGGSRGQKLALSNLNWARVLTPTPLEI